MVGARDFLVVAGVVPLATMTNSGRLSTKDYKAIGSRSILLGKDKVLKVVDLRSYSFSYIEVFAIYTPTTANYIPEKIVISLHSDSDKVEEVTWAKVHGDLNIKVYKYGNYLYLIHKNAYSIYCFITIRSNQINNKDYPLEILDSLPEGAEEILESS